MATHPDHSPSQTPAEREHQDNPKKAALPPEENHTSPVQAWIDRHSPPKEREEHRREQEAQAKKLQQRWERDEKDLPDWLRGQRMGFSAPEPKGAKDHKPHEFEQPQRADPPVRDHRERHG